MPVQACRMVAQDPVGTNKLPSPRGDEAQALLEKPSDSPLPRKAAHGATVVTVPQTDSGGRDEYSKARERTLVKELCKLTP